MRLEILNNGHSSIQKFQLGLIRRMMGGHLPGPIPSLSYRGKFFGKPMSAYVQTAMRKATEWSKKETELFAAFVSHNNRCQYCFTAHSTIAGRGTDEAVIQAVLDDWRTAPVAEKVRATLGFLEKLTLDPDTVTPADIAAMTAVGVSRQGIEEAMRICFVFCVINRLADAFEFEMPDATGKYRMGLFLYNMGYGVGYVPG